MTALLVALLIVALEGAKLAWHVHGRLRWVLAHLAAAAVLGSLWAPWVAFPAGVSVLASWFALDAKRRGAWWGNALSALSSWPWEIAGLASLGWLGAWLALPVGWISGLWWVSGLRPDHWGRSFWHRLYPDRLILALGGRP